MQRRPPKPRIAEPSSKFKPLTLDEHKQPRPPPRTFGVPNRIWLIFLGLLATIFLLHRFFPGPGQPRLPSYASGDLAPKNYFNTSSSSSSSSPLLNPFPFCPSNGPTDYLAAKYGPAALSQTRNFQGTGHRIHRVLKRALSGQPVTISIVGGSISACHGAGDDPISPKCYPSKFFDWWNTIFPHPASEITNGAMRRTNSDYFGYCSAHHIPDVTDLVIVELDSDDTGENEIALNFEFLIRSLLSRPDSPAVLILGHFSPQVYQTYGMTGPEYWHHAVANYYDVPYLYTKPILYPEYIVDPAKLQASYYADPVLANPLGHTVLADVLIAYFQTTTCHLWDVLTGAEYDDTEGGNKKKAGSGLFGGVGRRKGVPEPKEAENNDPLDVDPDAERRASTSGTDPLLVLPPGLMSPHTHTTTQANSPAFVELAPYCVSANDLVNPLPPSLFYGSGWQVHHPASSARSQSKHDVDGGATAEHFFYSSLPLSTIRIPIIVGHGDVGIYYLKEGRERLNGQAGSEVECWVDDNFPGRKVLNNLLDSGGVKVTLTLIDHSVAKGSHYVECQLMGEEGQGVPMFKIVGVFSN